MYRKGGRTHLVILVAPGVVLPHSQDKVEDRDEGADGVGVAAQCHVAPVDRLI